MLFSWLQPYYQQYLASLSQGRAPASIIIAGHPGLGGRHLALEIARAFLCQNRSPSGPCGHCVSCQSLSRYSSSDLKVAYCSTAEEAGSDADFTHDCSGLIVPPEAARSTRTMRIDTMRKVPQFINESAVGGVGKVVIIDGAEKMTTGAANAILKTFEEPAPSTMIIMVARSLEMLLPTILSRASKVVIRDVPIEQAMEYLLNRENQRPPLIRRAFADPAEQEEKERTALEACEGLKSPVTPERAAIALSLSSLAPLEAMKMLLSGEDIKAINVVRTLVDGIHRGDPYDVELIDGLNKLSRTMQITLLSELVLEVLKYKAWVPVEQLPLILHGNAQILERLQGDHLFEAADLLRHLQDRPNIIPHRAPHALVRSWLQAFKKDFRARR
ncbi:MULTISPECIES: DNA polymerase III subunit delta' [unclassified Anaerobiospirillum]|uniref:DNA polymerase III subunit delta' n=1 Tax=unclassified Anaerobiospirillum TaxID=2647410 RepID=UPI001FF2710C|nr:MULTISPECIES: DNA polymerase III subunit delta' [unclassified Anaerobiospirillum]MCK0534648.1 hypothetical protein [Anaerobiospirillum sp. NML120511]MCK0539904.1 hypothetical protein [Anaerobiospirillum sp. NML02-A-032]